MTRETAIALAESKWWVGLDPKEIAAFQLSEPKLCMDFSEFHDAVEKALNRPVWTHEFAYPELLIAELGGDREPPTLERIINMIPADKRIVIKLEARNEG